MAIDNRRESSSSGYPKRDRPVQEKEGVAAAAKALASRMSVRMGWVNPNCRRKILNPDGHSDPGETSYRENTRQKWQ